MSTTEAEQTPLLTVRETARTLRVSERLVHRMIATDDLPSIVIGRRARRVERAAIDDLIAQRREAEPTPAA